MSKQYGLILPNQQKNAVLTKEVVKPSIFDESSSSESQDGSGSPPKLRKNNPAIGPSGPSAMERRIARSVQKKALAEDPTIFQYDELYDDMANKRTEEQLAKSREPREAKYITKLIESAEKRKLEHELRIERQVQKEREAEGEKFKDKESFVTTTYRKKLEEMRKLEEQSKRDDYLENVGDVTKQKDLDGFYRHLYEQKLGTDKPIKKLELEPQEATSYNTNTEQISYKPIKSAKAAPNRAYRKRKCSDEDEKVGADENGRKKGKAHLTNNIDADSDFSIDDSSSDACSDEDESTEKKASSQQVKKNEKLMRTPANTIALNFESLKQVDDGNSTAKEANQNDETAKAEVKIPVMLKPKRNKSEIWGKRTVGAVFEDAVRRYYERKAARGAA
uniref:Nuclear speckle splicing regulatory protein 1 N-terminal domain-containing protein n=1 Tax=Glossina palpalis gambiensis TaxID=67801 RepID=A0A1B0AQH0_9MUSC